MWIGESGELRDQFVVRTYTPADPTSDTLNAWGRARAIAEGYRRSLASDARISKELRTS